MTGEIREYWDHPTRGEAILIYSVTRNENHMIRMVTNEHSDVTAFHTIEAARKRWRLYRETLSAAGFVRRVAARQRRLTLATQPTGRGPYRSGT
jgi:hypothetical protein